jgi:chromate transporter
MNEADIPTVVPYAAEPQQRPRESLLEIAALFFRFGALSFGGPAAQVALMEDELVRRRNWLDRQHLLDLYSAMNVIPGPNSTELAIALGYVRAGIPGLVVAGVSFVTPAVMIILPIAWAYARYGTLPQLQPMLLAINAGVIALLVVTFWRLITTAVKDGLTAFIAAAAAAVALLVSGRYQPELLILAASALLGALWYGRPRVQDALPMLALAAPASPLQRASSTRLFLAFLKIGATLYGSGYVLISYMRTTIVEQHGWLTERELLDSIAVGQITPGPVLTTATFAGYLIGARSVGGSPAGGVGGALLATIAIFSPAFVLVAILGGALQRIRHNRYVRGALDGMNAAVASLILIVTLQLAVTTFGHPHLHAGWTLGLDPLLLGVTVVASVALLRFDLNPTWIVLAAAAVGIARGF